MADIAITSAVYYTSGSKYAAKCVTACKDGSCLVSVNAICVPADVVPY